MATGEFVSVREYLSTSYRPDCDYVDGVVVERNLGEYDHARLQGEVMVYLHVRRKFGVAYVWILDPAARKAYRSTQGALTEIGELRTEDPEIVVPLQALFE